MTQKLVTAYKPPSFDSASCQSHYMTKGEQTNLKELGYQEGYKQGYIDGQKHEHEIAIQEHDKQVKKIVEKLYDAIQMLKNNNENYASHLMQHVNYSVALIIKKLFPFYLKREGKSELLSFVKQTVLSLLDNQDMKIFLHPSMLDDVKNYMDQQPEKSDAIHILPDNTLDHYACKMKWKCGGGIYNINGLHDKIDSLLQDGLTFSNPDRSEQEIQISEKQLVENGE